MDSKKLRPQYIDEIQGLRGVAILLVLLSHSQFLMFEGGFVGVDIFFVLSGFLISRLLLKEYLSYGAIDYFSFYRRRFLRLFPSMIAMLSLTLFIASYVLSGYELEAMTQSFFYAVTWTSNLYFSFVNIGYFDEIELRDMFLHTWSLGVEEQFYLIWPFVISACLLFLSKSFLVSAGKGYRRIAGLFLGGALVGFFLMVVLAGYKPVWAYYFMPARIWQFSLGAFVCACTFSYACGKGGVKKEWGGEIAGLSLIAAAVFLINSEETYPWWRSLLSSLGAAILLFVYSVAQTSGRRFLLSSSPLRFIGDRSYSWYLWHWPILMIGDALGMMESMLGVFSLILLSFLVAAISYRYVEIPFWRGGASGGGKRGALSVLTGLSLLLVLIAYMNSADISRKDQVAKAFQYSASDMPKIYQHGCDSWYFDSNVNPCVYGDGDAKKTVVLLGDSILLQWFSLFEELYGGAGWRVVVLTKSSCPMVAEPFFYKRIGGEFTLCEEWRMKVIDELVLMKPDLVVVGGGSGYLFDKRQWVDGSGEVFGHLSALASKVYVLLGTPPLGFNGPACLLRSLRRDMGIEELQAGDFCIGLEGEDASLQVKGYLEEAVRKYSGVELLDFNELVCPNMKCRALSSQGVVVYRDSLHLTNSFVLGLVAGAEEIIGNISSSDN